MAQQLQSSRAKRQMLRGAIAFIGASGAGKTLGALLVAYGMMKRKYPDMDEYELWGKIGVIDTEHERSLVYEGMMQQGITIGQFYHVNLTAPYTIQRFTQAFDILVNQDKVEVVIVDSTSHAWEGEGGVLDYQQQLGGRFQDWRDANKDAYNPFIKLITGEKHNVHVLNTMRAKQEYAMQPDDVGKMQVVKLGVKPVQRDSLEYEFQVVFNVGMDHKFQTSKDNSGLFEGKHEPLTPAHGAQLFDWLEAGVDIFAEKRAEAERLEQQRLGLIADIKKNAFEFDLNGWLQELLKHPYYQGQPLDNLSLVDLEKMRVGMQAKMEEAEKLKTTTNGGNE